MRPVASRLWLFGSLTAASLGAITLSGTSLAQDAGENGAVSPPPLPPSVAVSPQGEVSVTRTPARGVDVHAQTSDGTVHAYGCNRVTVDPRTGRPDSCPYAHPYAYPYPPTPAGPPVAYYRPYYRQPDYRPILADTRPPPKPRHAPDPTRKAALIASSLVFGLGTATAGTAFLASAMPRSWGAPDEPSKPALIAMGAFLTLPPSVPRYVVGDIGYGLLFTALRGGSFAAGTLIDWDDSSQVMPVTMAFVVPLTLGIVDLATTPRRDRPGPQPADVAESASVKLHGIAPTVAFDQTGSAIPAVSAQGTF